MIQRMSEAKMQQEEERKVANSFFIIIISLWVVLSVPSDVQTSVLSE